MYVLCNFAHMGVLKSYGITRKGVLIIPVEGKEHPGYTLYKYSLRTDTDVNGYLSFFGWVYMDYIQV